MTTKAQLPPGAAAVVLAIFITTLMMALSNNMLNVAVPVVAAHFQATPAQASAMVVAYSLVNVALLIPTGQLADALDRRLVFLGGLAFFILTSLLMGFSPNATVLAIGRGLQGAAAALLLSNAVALMAVVVPARRMAWAMGIYLAGFSTGQVGGPILGGVVASTVGWQWLFWGNVPLGLVALVLGARALRGVPGGRRGTPRVDVPGGILLGLFLGGTQLLLSLSAGLGLGDPRILGGFAACLLLLPLLAMVERRLHNPVLAPELFRNRALPIGLAQGFLLLLPRLGALTIASLYFQGIGGDSTATAALKAAPLAAGLTLGSLLADRVSAPLGPRRTMTTGAGMSAAAMTVLWLNVFWDADVVTLTALLVLGFGSGVFQTLNFAMITVSAPEGKTALVNAIRVMVSTFSTGIGLALSLALVVARAPEAVARAFLSGDAARVAADRHVIEQGYLLAYGSLTVLMWLGAALTLIKPRPDRS
ncbi:MAG: MFS transporter [Propionibacteriaceae bacterium]|nr:MFS transporter [Propionibacteriaceae bacterium]